MSLYLAAALLVGIGLAHSILGERYVIGRLERRGGLPPLVLGGRELMLPVLRFAWHLTTVAWFGLAAILVLMARGALTVRNAALAIAVTFLISALTSVIPSRGRHYSWVVFLAVALIALFHGLN